uniref:Uncharacterized protein n=1 Tax=Nicotiana tabacum TaxID=4097 RepID=A0A1S3XQM0_TOBAC|nr:PREDICTED: uncharacterized protein LOC107767476 [Nicotiana tabacum]
MLASIESANTICYQRTDLLYNCYIYKFSCFMREPTSSAALGMRTRKVTKWSKKMGGVKKWWGKWVENLKRKKTIRIRRRAVTKQLGKKVVNRRVKGRRMRRKLTKRVRRVVVMLPWRRRIEQRRRELQAIIRRGRAECSTTWRELVYEDNNADIQR